MPPLKSPPEAPRRAVSLPRALSKLGLCSRAQAFALISSGRVRVNGRESRDAMQRVSLELDRIELDGRAGDDRREPIVIALHKPVGYVTTRSDPQGRPTIYDLLPPLDRFVFPVGRLDKDTSGLLIVTDDHRLGEALTNPDSHVPKTYEAVVDREPDADQLARLQTALDIGRGETTRPAQVLRVTREPAGSTITLVIEEGKNRQVRRMLAAVGLKTLALKRTAIGHCLLAELECGKWERLGESGRGRLLSPR